MSNDISTGTICPYPFTFANKSRTDLASCTKTYGEGLDPELFVQQVVYGCFFGLISLPLFLQRFFLTVQIAWQRRKPWNHFSQSKVYLPASMLSFSVTVEMIDPYGLRNVAHPYIYFTANGFTAAFLLLIGFFFLDFYLTTAKRAAFQEGLSTRLVVFVLILTFANFIGEHSLEQVCS